MNRGEIFLSFALSAAANGDSRTSPQERPVSRIHDFLGYCLLPVEIRTELIQAPILHRLGDMRGSDFLAAGEIGDRAGHAQDAIHCPS